MKTKLELIQKTIRPSLGANDVIVEYYFTVTDSGRKNTYKVKCKVIGFETCDLYLDTISAELANWQESNQDTLTEAATIDLFQQTINRRS